MCCFLWLVLRPLRVEVYIVILYTVIVYHCGFFLDVRSVSAVVRYWAVLVPALVPCRWYQTASSFDGHCICQQTDLVKCNNWRTRYIRVVASQTRSIHHRNNNLLVRVSYHRKPCQDMPRKHHGAGYHKSP